MYYGTGMNTSFVMLTCTFSPDFGEQAIPDSIAGLEILEELNLASNLLEALPDSIGLLLNLKILNVSSNKLEFLPDSICHCR